MSVKNGRFGLDQTEDKPFPSVAQDSRNRIYVVWAEVKKHRAIYRGEGTSYKVRIEHSQGSFELTFFDGPPSDEPEVLREYLRGEVVNFADNLRARALASLHLSTDT